MSVTYVESRGPRAQNPAHFGGELANTLPTCWGERHPKVLKRHTRVLKSKTDFGLGELKSTIRLLFPPIVFRGTCFQLGCRWVFEKDFPVASFAL